MSALGPAVAVFLFTYMIIVSERLHRTVAALLGGILMILLGLISQEDAFHAIDLNVIFLLTGMMMIAHLMGETGVFQWLAVQSVRLGRGNPVAVMVIIAVVTAITSALLDNVTVVVLIAPVTLYVATTLGITPIPFLIAEVMASNIGGAATLIGDPPNILIASAADIDFLTFFFNMGPPALISLIIFIPIVILLFRKQLVVTEERRKAVMRLETKDLIHDPRLLVHTLIVLAVVLLGFVVQGLLHIEPATIALSGAVLLLMITRRDPTKILERVEWSTLMFFVGLFIVVEAVVKVGLIDRLAQILLAITAGEQRSTSMFILWFSALASGIVDNIPYTATMVPLIEDLAISMPVDSLWWALALGADLGGNLTLVGASANIVAASLAERSGHKITFGRFLRYGIIITLASLLVSSLWLLVAYL